MWVCAWVYEFRCAVALPWETKQGSASLSLCVSTSLLTCLHLQEWTVTKVNQRGRKQVRIIAVDDKYIYNRSLGWGGGGGWGGRWGEGPPLPLICKWFKLWDTSVSIPPHMCVTIVYLGMWSTVSFFFVIGVRVISTRVCSIFAQICYICYGCCVSLSCESIDSLVHYSLIEIG